MSKYDPLWQRVAETAGGSLVLTFDQIGTITGFPLDHAFLTCKKEPIPYRWQVQKVPMKAQTVLFTRIVPKEDV